MHSHICYVHKYMPNNEHVGHRYSWTLVGANGQHLVTMSLWTGSATRSMMYLMICSLQLQPALLHRHVSALCASLLTLHHFVRLTHAALLVLMWSYMPPDGLHSVAACAFAALCCRQDAHLRTGYALLSQPVSTYVDFLLCLASVRLCRKAFVCCPH